MLGSKYRHFESGSLNTAYPASYVCIGRVEYGSAFLAVTPLNIVKGVYSEMEEGLFANLIHFKLALVGSGAKRLNAVELGVHHYSPSPYSDV